MPTTLWSAIKKRCNGKIGSLLEILQGKLSKDVMEVVVDDKEGLLPHPKEIQFDCSCPDWANMCKHVAAVLYGIGNRLDHSPELLFQLRGVDAKELIETQLTIGMESTSEALNEGDLADIFNIDFETPPETKKSSTNKKTVKSKKSKDVLDLNNLTGKKLQKFRKDRGLSVMELADALNVTTTSIYRWEANVATINLQLKSKEALTKLLKR